MGLLFIPEVIYEDGGPLWNDIDMIRPTQLSGNPTSRHLVANRRNFTEEMMNLAFEVSLSIP
jgi:hypothetical protein